MPVPNVNSWWHHEVTAVVDARAVSADKVTLADELLDTTTFFHDPYPAYRRLREDEPVAWSGLWGQWLVTRHADVMNTLRDTERFSNTGRFVGMLDRLPPEYRRELAPLYEHIAHGWTNVDGAEHRRLRALTSKTFHPRAIDAFRPRVQVIVDELLEAGSRGSEIDVVRDLTFPLPTVVITELLGVPLDDRARFKQLVDDSQFHGPPDTSHPALLDRARRAAAAIVELTDWLRPHIDDRRRHPKDDLLTALVAAQERGEIQGDGELVTMCIILVRAGEQTTQALIGNGLFALLRNRDQLRLLQANPELMSGAVEEFLRFDPPFLRTVRRVVDDMDFEGTPLRAGDLVSLMLGSANRDPEQFSEPDRFDIARPPSRHVAFGYGVHFCLGAPLARLEAEIAVFTLITRWPGLELSHSPVHHQYIADNVFHSLKALPVRLHG